MFSEVISRYSVWSTQISGGIGVGGVGVGVGAGVVGGTNPGS